MAGCEVVQIYHEPATLEVRGFDSAGQDMGDMIDDDSAAYGETGWEYSDTLVASNDTRTRCYSVCDHDHTIQQNACIRTAGEIALISPIVGAAVGAGVAVWTWEGGGLTLGWSAFKYTTGAIAASGATYGAFCNWAAADRQTTCYTYCDVSNGPSVQGSPTQ